MVDHFSSSFSSANFFSFFQGGVVFFPSTFVLFSRLFVKYLLFCISLLCY